MRWSVLGALLITMTLALGTVQSGPAPAQAQEATPPASPGAAEGVKASTLASGSLEVLNPGTAFLALGRVTLAPGATVPFNPTDPSATLLLVTTGTLTFTVDTDMTVARHVEPGTPTPAQPEVVPANTQFTMAEGDSALFPPALTGEVRNDGSDDAAAWVSTLAISSAAGTPTP